MSIELDRKSLKSLLELHKADNSVFISNGFLARVEENKELVESLSKEEKAFLEASVDEFNKYNLLQYEANQENVNALAHAEAIAKTLEEQNAELEKAKKAAEVNRDDALRELDQKAQQELDANRQRAQFTILKTWWAPGIFTISMVLLIGSMFLTYVGKESETLLLILGTCMGTLFSAFAVGNSAVFTPIIKDEPTGKKRASKETET